MSKGCALIEAAKKSYEYWAELAKLDFSTLLGEVMDEQGMTKTQLAEKAAVSKAYISKVLGGEAVNFTLESIAKLMFALEQRVRFIAEPIIEKAPENLEQLYDLAQREQKQQRSSKVLCTSWHVSDAKEDRGERDPGQLYPSHQQEESGHREVLAA